MLIISLQVAFGHQENAKASGAIIDPLMVHHAHIEDEQRIILSVFGGVSNGRGGKRAGFRSLLELAYNWSEGLRFGSEVLIPFSNTGFDSNHYGIGDIELWPIKYAFVSEKETILTGILTLGLPTGSESKGVRRG